MYVIPLAFRLLDIMGIRPAGMLCMSGGRGDLQGASCNGWYCQSYSSVG